MTSTSGSSEVTAEKKTKTAPKRSASARASKSAPDKSATKRPTPKKTATAKPTAPKRAAVKKTATKKAAKHREDVVVSALDRDAFDDTTEETVSRKAPTAFAARAAMTLRKRRQIITASALLLVGIASSAAVGFSDVGRIDINQKITERNERIKNNQATNEDLMAGSATLPVQNTSGQVDGGLIGLVGTTPPSPSSTGSSSATSTASSTAITASSTASSTDALVPQVAGASSSAPAVTEAEPAIREESQPTS